MLSALWKILVRKGAISLAKSFNILAVIRSGPQALLGLIFSNNLSTPSSVMLISGIDGKGLPAGFGIVVLVSSLVNTDSLCLLSMSALSFGSAMHFAILFQWGHSAGVLA